MNKRVQEMHEQIILMLIAFDLVGSEPDILKHILINTYFTLRGKVKLIIILQDSCPEILNTEMYDGCKHVPCVPACNNKIPHEFKG